jgi:hypothetical protein
VVPEEFVLLILLITWLRGVQFDKDTEIVEFFAGACRVAKWGHVRGYSVAALDITYSENKKCMDMNNPAGFVYHGYICIHCVFC